MIAGLHIFFKLLHEAWRGNKVGASAIVLCRLWYAWNGNKNYNVRVQITFTYRECLLGIQVEPCFTVSFHYPSKCSVKHFKYENIPFGWSVVVLTLTNNSQKKRTLNLFFTWLWTVFEDDEVKPFSSDDVKQGWYWFRHLKVKPLRILGRRL